MTAPRVGYVLKRHPTLSETFVRNEIDELRRQGIEVEPVSLVPGDHDIDVGQVTVASRDLDGRARRLADTAWWAATHPVRFARFLRACAVLREEVRRKRLSPIVLPSIARLFAARGVTSLHAHFGWDAAAAAWAVAELLDVPWSMTLHANDIFGRRVALEQKIAASDHVITVCEYNRRWLEEHIPIATPVTVVVCGVEVPPSRPRTPDRDVVAVGRLVEKKGFDVLVDAVAQLHPGRPDLRVEIVGDGPLRADLEARVRAAGLEGVVTLAGARSHDEALQAIERSRVFVLPCRVAANGDRDSMPVVIKEAMARAVPVVATNEVAVPEMVDDTCGILVAPDDAGALAAAIAKVLDDEDLAARLGAGGRRRVETAFTLRGEVAKLAGVFSELAA